MKRVQEDGNCVQELFINVVREYPATEFLELSLSNRVQEHSATQFRSTATVFSNFLELGNRV